MVCCSNPSTKETLPAAPHVPRIDANNCGCGTLKAKSQVGPFLRFRNYDSSARLWTGSVLFVSQAEPAPSLRFRIDAAVDAPSGAGFRAANATGPAKTIDEASLNLDGGSPVLLDEYSGWKFWRFDLSIKAEGIDQAVSYKIDPRAPGSTDQPPQSIHTFFVPAATKSWTWGFSSCNGFDSLTPLGDQQKRWGGLEPLWNDLSYVHNVNPLALMVQGGDQLYNDDVFTVPTLKAWLANPRAQLVAEAFAPEMAEQASEYYFHHYAVHFSSPHLAPILAGIPQICTWDDHDIFDGFGSYPFELQTCPVFNGIFAIAQRFYFLFQQHSTLDRAAQDGLIRGKHLLVQAGPDLALMLPDQRGDRTRYQIVEPVGSHELVTAAFKLPDTVKHLVFVATVPVVYPHVIGAVTGVKALKRAYQKAGGRSSGLGQLILDSFNEPSLLDDLRDHWNTPEHQEERTLLIQQLQLLARSKGARVSFLSGDVHLSGIGRLYSAPIGHPEQIDFRFMVQVISSAIGNVPPGLGSVELQEAFGGTRQVTPTTSSKMIRVFKDKTGDQMMLLNRRNWCHVRPDGKGGLGFTIRVEDFENKYKGPQLVSKKSKGAPAADPPGAGVAPLSSGIMPPKIEAYTVFVPPLIRVEERSKLAYQLYNVAKG